jgi:hypothetical protein
MHATVAHREQDQKLQKYYENSQTHVLRCPAYRQVQLRRMHNSFRLS